MRSEWVTFLAMGAFGALFVLAAVASFDAAPPQLNSPVLSTRIGIPVLPIVETGPSHHAGDTADDVAIWIHPTDPSRSSIWCITPDRAVTNE